MKRLTAISFLFILLFNLLGYRLVFDYLQQQHDIRFTAQLDKSEYADEDLISIKTPLSLPYYNNSEKFERVDGAIEVNGIEYKYVKRRVFNDSLELLCLPNTEKQKLQVAKIDFFKLSNDWQNTEHGKKVPGIIKNVLPEFCNHITDYSFQRFSAGASKYYTAMALRTPSLLHGVQQQPPDVSMHIFS